MTAYLTVYERFSQKITDYGLAALSDADLETMLHGFLMSSTAKFKKCKTDLSDRDDTAKKFNNDLLDIEIEVLAIMMVSEWLEPQVFSVTNTQQVFGNEKTKFYSQANQLEVLVELKEKNDLKARKLLRDYSFTSNAYFE